MTKQEEMWAGKFGDEYTNRCFSYPFFRRPFWGRLFTEYYFKNVLEVGCGDGKNTLSLLWYMNDKNVYGIDINKTAIQLAQKNNIDAIEYINAFYGQATDIPFKDNFFDLVFTCGLLIHIPPDDLLPVMSEMVRCSHKYVMFMEYWAEKEEEIEYRGEMGLLWKRPYKDIFLSFYSRHSQYECIDEGFLTKDDGFDDVTWWLFERR